MTRILSAFAALWLAVIAGHLAHNANEAPSFISKADASMLLRGVGKPVSAAGCSEATTFLARVTSPSATTITAATRFICDAVTAGLIDGDLSTTGCGSIFDIIYFGAAQDAATSRINVCENNYNATVVGTLSYANYAGYTGVDISTANYLSSGFNPTSSSPPRRFLQNGNHISCYVNNDYTPATGGGACAGIQDGSGSFTRLFPKVAAGTTSVGNTASAGTYILVSNSNAVGYYIATRTAASGAGSTTLYKNGASFGTGSVSSGTQPSYTIPVLAMAGAGGTVSNGGAWQLSFFSLGGPLNSTQAAALTSLVAQYRTDVGL